MTLVAEPTGSRSDHAPRPAEPAGRQWVSRTAARGAALGSALKGNEAPERGVRKALLSTVDVTGESRYLKVGSAAARGLLL
jgi:hypothetical protein